MMKARCKKISTMMRSSTRAVAALQHVQPGPSLISSVSSLQSQSRELVTVLDRLTPTQLLPTGLKAEHSCFINDFISLLEVLVPQMSRLEILATSSSMPLQDTGFGHLWSLLYSSSRAFSLWPAWWLPAQDLDFIPLIAILDDLMSLLLLVTRPRALPWADWDSSGPLGRRTQAFTLLHVPLNVTTMLAQQPSVQSMAVLMKMRPLFFARLCCIACEQLSDLPFPEPIRPRPVAAAAAVATSISRVMALAATEAAMHERESTAGSCAPEPTSGTSTRQNPSAAEVPAPAAELAAAARDLEINLPDSSPVLSARFPSKYHLFFWYLASAFGNLGMPIFKTWDVRVLLFTHSSVIELLKASLIIRAGFRHTDPLLLQSEHKTMNMLARVVGGSAQINHTAEGAPAGARPAHAVGGAGVIDGWREARPRLVASARQLMTTLCQRIRVFNLAPTDIDTLARHLCIDFVIQSWSKDQVPGLPFPTPAETEQICGIIPLLHHFSTAVLPWMEQQQGQQQQGHGQRQQQQGVRVQQECQLLQPVWSPAMWRTLSLKAILPLMNAAYSVQEGEEGRRWSKEACSQYLYRLNRRRTFIYDQRCQVLQALISRTISRTNLKRQEHDAQLRMQIYSDCNAQLGSKVLTRHWKGMQRV